MFTGIIVFVSALAGTYGCCHLTYVALRKLLKLDSFFVEGPLAGKLDTLLNIASGAVGFILFWVIVLAIKLIL